ncbi:hypothetical protein MPER_06235 [Moniliophthora perniciosa FA553]|nr:hypothetical protein MPER_06235 [Moniliophthora perniciosa FA553]
MEDRPIVANTSDVKVKTSVGHLLSPPSRMEIRACWELCRLHNNIGFWVVWLPTAWSIAMLYHSNNEITWLEGVQALCSYVPLCFGIKSLIMTIDDILDYDIDEKVERTKNRCIPRGAITLQRAWLFFALQVVLGVYMAFRFLGIDSLRISMVVWPLYVLYPTCKRWMYLAPVPLGLMFNIGVFMGWSDLNPNGSIAWQPLVPVYVGAYKMNDAVLWNLVACIVLRALVSFEYSPLIGIVYMERVK